MDLPTDNTTVVEETNRVMKKLDGPGVIFGEARREGQVILIPVMMTAIRGGMSVTRPMAVIVISGQKVRVKSLQRGMVTRLLMVFALTGFIGACAALLFPPWRPGESLLAEVAKLLKTIRTGA